FSRSRRRYWRRRSRDGFTGSEALQAADQLGIVAGRLLAMLGKVLHDMFDGGERLEQHEADALRDVDGAALHLGEDFLGSRGNGFEAVEIEEATRAFDGVDQAVNRIEDIAVGRVLVELDELAIKHGERGARLADEFADQVVHHLPVPAMVRVGRRYYTDTVKW